MKEYAYSLELSVTDGGKRSFSASGEEDDQGSLVNSVACDIARALEMLNMPPTAAQLAYAVNQVASNGGRDIWGMLAYLDSHWTGDHNFDDAFRIQVDLGKLMPSADDDERESVRKHILRLGWSVKNSAQSA